MWLKNRNIHFVLRDIFTSPPTTAELKSLSESSNIPLDKLFNVNGKAFKELSLKELLPSLTAEEKLDLLSKNPMLVKRPILWNGETVMVAFNESAWESALK